L
ncbi:hypothetical protein ADUPG1_011782, partial [Aduncisulcus paluster]|jgi:nuclear pore complex protein Nup155